MREKVLRYIRERDLMRAGDRVAVAVSGGADSVALLRVLLELRAELGIVLAVAHFNHGLRGTESETDQAFVANLAREHGLEFFAGRENVRDYATTNQLSLEAAGRKLRYEWLVQLAEEQRFNSVATAHTLDDQAETVLLKFLRGAGTRGLAGIYPSVEAQNNVRIVRPLLSVTRDEVEIYLSSLGQSWREDETNLDRRHARNRVRHELLPLLEREYNPNLRQVLSDSADVARAEEEYWQTLAERELEARTSAAKAPSEMDGLDGVAKAAPLRRDAPLSLLGLRDFPRLPRALKRRLLRRFAESEGMALNFVHVDMLLRCALGKLTHAELPGGWMAARRGECLELRAPCRKPASVGYQYALPVPGEVCIAAAGLTLRAMIVREKFAAETSETDNLLRADLLGTELTVRNWRPGDRFWPAHTGSEEKLKRLFAEKHIPAELRPSWPVALHGEQIIWVRGLPAARAFAWGGRGDAVKIESISAKQSTLP